MKPLENTKIDAKKETGRQQKAPIHEFNNILIIHQLRISHDSREDVLQYLMKEKTL